MAAPRRAGRYSGAPTRSRAIRILATILIAALIALAVGCALYALVLAVGRDPVPGADASLRLPTPRRLEAPERLRPVPGIDTRSLEPIADAAESRRITLPIAVAQVSAELRQGAAGVAIFHRITGGDFRWLPLTDAIPGPGERLLVTGEAHDGSSLTITFAASREHARHGYVDRADVDVTSADGRTAPVIALDGRVHHVRFDLPTGADRAGPLRLQRVDDRQWLPMLHRTSGLTLRRGQTLELLLGGGEYELRDPLVPERSQRFSVDGDAVVEVSAALAPARDGRL